MPDREQGQNQQSSGAASLAGSTIDRYAVEALIGRGGMGEVYRAVDERLRRKVALKVLRPDKTRPDAVARLFREARAAAALSHPNAVAIHDIGEDAGLFYIVMELVSGVPLLGYVGDERVSLERKLRWLTEIARALHGAHRAGVLHRDVKPSNVMISEDDVAKVLDFGLAKPVEPQSLDFRTQAGRIVGTVRYMAPEQLSGSEVDPRADQYSFGVTAYELLAGQYPGGRPFGAVAPLDELRPDVPPDCARVIARTMQQAPRDRFASMADVVSALEDLAGGRPLRVPLATTPAAATVVTPSDAPEPSKAPSTPVMADTVRDPNARSLPAPDPEARGPSDHEAPPPSQDDDLTVKASPPQIAAILAAAPASPEAPRAQPADQLRTMVSREAPPELKLLGKDRDGALEIPKGTVPLPAIPAPKGIGPPTLASPAVPPPGASPAASIGATTSPLLSAPVPAPSGAGALSRPTPNHSQPPVASRAPLAPPASPAPAAPSSLPPRAAPESKKVGVALAIAATLVIVSAGVVGTYLGGREAPAPSAMPRSTTSAPASPSTTASEEIIPPSASSDPLPAPPLDPAPAVTSTAPKKPTKPPTNKEAPRPQPPETPM